MHPDYQIEAVYFAEQLSSHGWSPLAHGAENSSSSSPHGEATTDPHDETNEAQGVLYELETFRGQGFG
jgi:hypothetical protein